jgi:hypothetical protein
MHALASLNEASAGTWINSPSSDSPALSKLCTRKHHWESLGFRTWDFEGNVSDSEEGVRLVRDGAALGVTVIPTILNAELRGHASEDSESVWYNTVLAPFHALRFSMMTPHNARTRCPGVLFYLVSEYHLKASATSWDRL